MARRKKHTPEQVVRKLATADRKPRRDKYTTWTAVAPDLVFTVLAYGPSPLYGHRQCAISALPTSKLAGHRAAPSDTPESCPKSGPDSLSDQNRHDNPDPDISSSVVRKSASAETSTRRSARCAAAQGQILAQGRDDARVHQGQSRYFAFS
jgi:hypothetical protein